MLKKRLSKKKTRQAKILTELVIFPEMKVNELAERLNVSSETIRRDLAELSREGRVSRTFGGAVSLSNIVPGLNERKNIMISERDQISSIAASLIEPNDLLMIGGGSTTMRFALALMTIEFPITIVTHSLPLATSVSKNKHINVELLPGRLVAEEGLTTGTNTLKAIKKFSTHKAFIGASGVNEKGFYALLEPGEVYATMIDHSKSAFLLIDSSKFGVTSLSQYGQWNPKLTLITDSLPDDAIQESLSANTVEILMPE